MLPLITYRDSVQLIPHVVRSPLGMSKMEGASAFHFMRLQHQGIRRGVFDPHSSRCWRRRQDGFGPNWSMKPNVIHANGKRGIKERNGEFVPKSVHGSFHRRALSSRVVDSPADTEVCRCVSWPSSHARPMPPYKPKSLQDSLNASRTSRVHKHCQAEGPKDTHRKNRDGEVAYFGVSI